MASTSETTKRCPNCRSLLAGDAFTCSCGYRFEVMSLADNRPSSDLVTQAEELYATHLRARLQRAMRGVKLAKVDLLRDPANPSRKTTLREAESEVKVLEMQLSVQIARVADAQAAATRLRNESAIAELPAESPSSDASETFRATQAVKAEQTFELVRLQRAAEEYRANHATGGFKAAQVEKTREALSNLEAAQACPNCGAPVAIGVARCQCGHQLVASNDGGNFISAEEFAALRGGER